jgi:hypothetical protein
MTELPLEDIKKLSRAYAQIEDDIMRNAVIGTRILDLKVEPIKNRKHMVYVTITTDGISKVPIRKIGEEITYATVNPLKFKVKL